MIFEVDDVISIDGQRRNIICNRTAGFALARVLPVISKTGSTCIGYLICAQHFVYLGKLAVVITILRALSVCYAQFREARAWASEFHRAVAEAAGDFFVGVDDIAN